MKVLMYKQLGALRPIDEVGEGLLHKIKNGNMVMVEIRRPRNPYFHRKFFAMLNIILQNQEHYKSIDDLLDVCKLRIGHVRTIETKDGLVRLPASISFANMSEDDFSVFYDRAVDWMLAEVIPGLQHSDLTREVEERLMRFAA